ncbi:unnamed protein product [Urochloa decumbens]|uniref:GOLD domain-containing protein n=1 Tax=Urochloa decumbens TaxID=240449 RepID=A0ABC9FUW8_9POAL
MKPRRRRHGEPHGLPAARSGGGAAGLEATAAGVGGGRSVAPCGSDGAQADCTDMVTSPFGDVVHKKEKVSMEQFSFTTAEAGNYLACFWIDGEDRKLMVKLNLDWKIGIAAKDWDSVAKKEKIEGVELEMLKLETAVQSIHENLLLLKSKEANMRDVSEKTNARITWLSLLSLSVCVAVSVLQLWHLQQYFRKKKLI